MSRILVVEDEERIARFMERGLRAAGHTVEVAADGARALAAVRASAPDLVVLDLGLPDIDGLEVLSTLRGEGHRMPVVILTARDDVADKVTGFESGADDYVTKPFAFEELLVRVRARLREQGRNQPQELVHGDLRLDLRTHRVRTPDLGERELSAREFALLEALMRHPGAIRSREELLDRVWGFDFDPGSNVVEVYIRYLRRKVGADRIRTVRGAGYRMA
jgi:DNA-binding response OmpR family regulator